MPSWNLRRLSIVTWPVFSCENVERKVRSWGVSGNSTGLSLGFGGEESWSGNGSRGMEFSSSVA